MTPESSTTSNLPERATTRSVAPFVRQSSFLRIAGIFLFEFFTVYQHGEKRSVLRA